MYRASSKASSRASSRASRGRFLGPTCALRTPFTAWPVHWVGRGAAKPLVQLLVELLWSFVRSFVQSFCRALVELRAELRALPLRLAQQGSRKASELTISTPLPNTARKR